MNYQLLIGAIVAGVLGTGAAAVVTNIELLNGSSQESVNSPSEILVETALPVSETSEPVEETSEPRPVVQEPSPSTGIEGDPPAVSEPVAVTPSEENAFDAPSAPASEPRPESSDEDGDEGGSEDEEEDDDDDRGDEDDDRDEDEDDD